MTADGQVSGRARRATRYGDARAWYRKPRISARPKRRVGHSVASLRPCHPTQSEIERDPEKWNRLSGKIMLNQNLSGPTNAPRKRHISFHAQPAPWDLIDACVGAASKLWSTLSRAALRVGRVYEQLLIAPPTCRASLMQQPAALSQCSFQPLSLRPHRRHDGCTRSCDPWDVALASWNFQPWALDPARHRRSGAGLRSGSSSHV